MKAATRDITHVRQRRQPTAGSTVHASRRPRRAHTPKVRFVHTVRARLVLAARKLMEKAVLSK